MNRKQGVLILLVLSSFTAGLAEPLLAHTPYGVVATWAQVLVFSVLSFAWYRFDSDDRGYRRSRSLNVCVIALSSVGIPYYLLRSRGLRTGALAWVWLVGFCLCLLLAAFLGALLALLPVNSA